MDTQKHDKAFVMQFGVVLAILGAFTATIIVLANVLDKTDEPDAAAQARLEQRIQPVGQVITDPQALLKLTAAAAAARAPMSGDEVVSKVCGACHASGVLGAPKIGDAGAWSSRKSKAGGLGGLVKVAAKGVNQMPPRGGDATLSDDELKAAVEAMLKKSGG